MEVTTTKQIVIVLSYIILIGLKRVYAQSTATELTFYSDKVDWKVANDVCQQTGSSLVHISNNVLQQAVTQKWISYEIFQTPGSTYWTHNERWDYNYMDIFDTALCVRIRPELGSQEVADCQDPSYFVCERATGTLCSFRRIEKARLSWEKQGYDTTKALNKTSQGCLDVCGSFSSTGGDCWAVSYTNSTSQFVNCYLHYGQNLSLIQEPESRVDNVNFTLYMKTCFSAHLEPAGFVDKLLAKVNITTNSTVLATDPSTTTNPKEPDGTSTATITTMVQSTKPTSALDATPDRVTSTAITTPGTIKPTKAILTTLKQLTSAASDSTPVTQGSYRTTVTMSKSSYGTSTTARTAAYITTEYSNTAEIDDKRTNVTSGYQCSCVCPVASQEDREIFLETILEPLRLNSSNLSSSRRRYISAPDDRPTSQVVGYVSGLCILLTVLFIISADLLTIKRFCEAGQSNRRHQKDLP